MKQLSLLGFILSFGTVFFGLHIIFNIVPRSEIAESVMERVLAEHSIDSNSSANQSPEYQEAFEVTEKTVDYSTGLFFAAIFSFLLCIYPAIKLNLLGILGAILSLCAFFIAVTCGTHIFS